MKKYTTTETLGKKFLKVTGENIGRNQATFGGNVGIEEIKLNGDKPSTANYSSKALISYLKRKWKRILLKYQTH